MYRTSGNYPGSFQRRRFTNEDITVTLPDGVDACDIGTITIWCQPFRAIFTRLAIPRSTFVSACIKFLHFAGRICNLYCGRPCMLNLTYSYSGTSHKGLSEMRSASIQRTNHVPPIDFAIEIIHFKPLRDG